MLITTSQTLDMLATLAPRAWAKRLLKALVLDGEVDLYARQGLVTETVWIGLLTFGKRTADGTEDIKPDPEEVARIYGEEVAEAIEGKALMDEVELHRGEWKDEPRNVPFALLLTDQVDFEAGSLTFERYGISIPDEWLSTAEESFSRYHRESTQHIVLDDLCCSLAQIELLAPQAIAPAPIAQSQATETLRGGPGRPPKWDWEGALAAVTAIANSVDGLPTGLGAQAEVERSLAEYFIAQSGASPAESELRKRASRIMQAIDQRGKEGRK
jgi:hypothetical protein